MRSERVDPATQGFQPLPGLIAEAVRNGYETPEENKIKQVDELHFIATERTIEPHIRVAAIRTAQQADKDQWERDNPELAGKVKGGVSVDNHVHIHREQYMQIIADIERETGRKLGAPPALQQIEDAAQVLPEELNKTE